MSGPKVLSAEELRMRAEAEERLRLVQDYYRKAEVLKRTTACLEDTQLILVQTIEDSQAQRISSQLSTVTQCIQKVLCEWESISLSGTNAQLKKYIEKLNETIQQSGQSLTTLRQEAELIKKQYIDELIKSIPHRVNNDMSSSEQTINRSDDSDILAILVHSEKERLDKLISNIESRAKRIHALTDVSFNELRKSFEDVFIQYKDDNYSLYQALHQFDVFELQLILRQLEKAEENYDALDSALSLELASYHAVCAEYGIEAQRFPFSNQSIQAIRYATAEILQRENLSINYEEIMVRIRKALSKMGYSYIGEKEEERKVYRQVYRIHDKTVLHVIFDSTGRVTMEVAIEDDQDRVPSKREIQQIVDDQGEFCHDFERVLSAVNDNGIHLKKELMCPCGEEYALIINTSGFNKSQESSSDVDYSIYESPENKYLELR